MREAGATTAILHFPLLIALACVALHRRRL
jgi:hypothetical protein